MHVTCVQAHVQRDYLHIKLVHGLEQSNRSRHVILVIRKRIRAALGHDNGRTKVLYDVGCVMRCTSVLRHDDGSTSKDLLKSITITASGRCFANTASRAARSRISPRSNGTRSAGGSAHTWPDHRSHRACHSRVIAFRACHAHAHA